MLRKALITLGTAVALGCVPFATNALAAPHGHVGGGHAMTGLEAVLRDTGAATVVDRSMTPAQAMATIMDALAMVFPLSAV